MRENRSSGSEGGVALTPPSLPLSHAPRLCKRPVLWRQLLECGGLEAALDWAGRPSSRLRCGRAGKCFGECLKTEWGGLPTQGGAALALG